MRSKSSGVVYLVVRDRPLQERLARLLNACGLRAEAYDSLETLLRFHRGVGPACAVVEVCEPATSAADLHADLARRGVRLPVLYLVAARKLPAEMTDSGAAELLSTPVDAAHFVESVRAALAPAAQECLGTIGTTEWLPALTPREREVLELVISGCRNQEVAQRLGISPRTVEVHRAHILAKSGARNILELAQLVRQMPRRYSQDHSQN